MKISYSQNALTESFIDDENEIVDIDINKNDDIIIRL